MTDDRALTLAIEKIAKRALLGGRLRLAWGFCFGRKRRAAVLAAIRARSCERDVVSATLRMWLNATDQRAEKALTENVS